ncbi:hypothetical protein BJX99DRAFT_246249 [Aspergillus californicus]
MSPTQDIAEQAMLKTPSVHSLRHWSKLYSAEAHLAGDLAHAERIRKLWCSYGIPSKLQRYDVLQNFPLSTALELRSNNGTVIFKATLKEDELEDDPTSSQSNGLPAFHGFSANGDVEAELVYANFGTPEDFASLQAKGVDVRGKIVICKYSKIFRGLKVRAAQDSGAVGVIMYNDPQEDGEYTTKNGYRAYPHGPARHPSSIQRGSVDFFSVAVGDPTTPGYPSLPGDDTERGDPHRAIPTTPSIPISFRDAIPFLRSLDGLGLSPDVMAQHTEGWHGELEGVGYYTGPSRTKVFLSNQGNFQYSPIYNVIGTIEGETEQTIVLGNHHDSWCCGAVDPVSGSAAMNEVARGLGNLVARGWKPYRKLILASWDNEEYGLVGSTEWVEDNLKCLSENCVAYINVDEATNGGQFLGAIGSPLLDSVLRSASALVPSPVSEGKSVYDDWLEDLRRRDGELEQPSLALLGTGSDYTAFFHHLGIPSIDMVFNQQGQAVYPYHSNYDSYYWLEKFGDVGFKKHKAMAQLWGVLAVKLAGPEVIPFATVDYPTTLLNHFVELKDRNPGLDDSDGFRDILDRFIISATRFDERVSRLKSGRDHTAANIAKVNHQLNTLERAFLLDRGSGLNGRPWYRHQIFAPGLWLGYDGVVFPTVQEALAADDLCEANRRLRKLANVISKALDILL